MASAAPSARRQTSASSTTRSAPDPLLGDAKSVQAREEGHPSRAHQTLGAASRRGPRSDRGVDAALAKHRAPSDSLWSTIEGPRGRHALGFGMPHADERAAMRSCGSCGFAQQQGKRLRCLKTERSATPEMPACQRWEPAPECATCGACCREAFDLIEVAARDPFQKKHKHLLVMRDHGRADLVRPRWSMPAAARRWKRGRTFWLLALRRATQGMS